MNLHELAIFCRCNFNSLFLPRKLHRVFQKSINLDSPTNISKVFNISSLSKSFVSGELNTVTCKHYPAFILLFWVSTNSSCGTIFQSKSDLEATFDFVEGGLLHSTLFITFTWKQHFKNRIRHRSDGRCGDSLCFWSGKRNRPQFFICQFQTKDRTRVVQKSISLCQLNFIFLEAVACTLFKVNLTLEMSGFHLLLS